MSWRRTVVAYWVGAIVTGTAWFSLAGLIGSWFELGRLNPWLALGVVAVAATLDLVGIRPPGPRRQVDEDWLGRYRDWVIGFGFGAQLGLGFVTIVPSWGYWAILAAAMGVGFPQAVMIGVGFGVGRSLLLVTARGVRSPMALAELMRRFTGAERLARGAAVAGYAIVLVVLYAA